ncbi:hypothetical protein [Clostridium sp. HV4-5-A1G]|uniref:hypothetical protein n=1 Tax=Clostridium sp. HV4-5-A1G TaxID=2004595 RepID=UPI00123A25A3|nr:hypothetical protein [Clostridium sp. HV4-5-A1G]KAA8673286.1 hypothetical protein F3O63_09270 [Clostridium sp. HV4-5-A1G]CAB1262711.1 conserved hypothetical protein [Clostridiaceae bacterium BL-3]
MYPYIRSDMGIMPMCCYCRINNGMRGALKGRKYRSMFRNGEYEENRIDSGGGATTVQPIQQAPDTNQQMPDVNQQMPEMMEGMSESDMEEKINSDTQEIISMFERHHPDIINTLICCNMSIDDARQYLSRVVKMALMHHMMHQV